MSHSQRARVATEQWAVENLFCPRCEADALRPLRAGQKVSDFTCADCSLNVQLKAKRGAFRSAFANSAYKPKLEAIRARELPDYALMSYSLAEWAVTDLTFLPGHFITEERVEARKPLGPHARRAGWIGSTVVLRDLPPDAFVRVIDEGTARSSATVREQYARFAWLKESKAESVGWTTDVLREVRAVAPLVGVTFTLAEIYERAEERLAAAYPANKHIRDKVRQQLQLLRDRGFIRFDGRGTYTVLR